MSRLDDADFAFFLSSNSSNKQRRPSIYERGRVWTSDVSRRTSSKRLTYRIRELSQCSFTPQLTRKGDNVRSSFQSRLAKDSRSREQSRVITEFMRQHEETKKLCQYSFKPDLSLTSKFRFSRYLTRPIKISY